MSMEIPYTVDVRPDTGLTNGKLGIWLFLASEVMLFGALFASYVMLRVGSPRVAARAPHYLNIPLATLNTVILISSSVTMVLAWASLVKQDFSRFRAVHGDHDPVRVRLPDRSSTSSTRRSSTTATSRPPTPSWRSTSRSRASTACT